MEIVKLIGADVLPDDQKLVLEIAKVIRVGFLQQNAFHKDDTSVPLTKQFKNDGDHFISVQEVKGTDRHGNAYVRVKRGQDL